MTLIKDGREKERKLNTQWNCLFSWLMVKRQLHFLLKSSDPLFLNCLSFVFCSWIELNYPCVHDRVCFHLYYSSENHICNAYKKPLLRTMPETSLRGIHS